MDFRECDYVLDSQDNFHIVRGYWNDENILTHKVFEPDENGDRFNKITEKKYKKVINDHFEPTELNRENVKKHFKPRNGFQKKKDNLEGSIWEGMYKEIISAGVSPKDIGIFGSHLIGFSIQKDVDFVVYGRDNHRLLKGKMSQIKERLGVGDISKKHIEYQRNKYGQYHDLTSNDFKELLKNKWNSLQIEQGVLSTIRFLYKKGEEPENIFNNEKIMETTIQGGVIDGDGSDFTPRTFTIRNNEGKYKVGTFYWAFQSCVKRGIKVKITGTLRKGNVFTIDKPMHGIEVL